MSSRQTAPPLILLVLLLAFPQLSETLYAPALPGIAAYFHVSAAAAQWTVSVDFLAFALGVVCWGRLSDRWGRRPALLAALLCYGLGAVLTWFAPTFTLLLLSRALLTFGASAGSIVIQTMLRDLYHGPRLAAVFSLVGGVLALSPAIGPTLGAWLVGAHGIHGVFLFVCALALLLILASFVWGRETRPQGDTGNTGYVQVWRRTRSDRHVLATAWKVAGFNILLFGYYTLAPFTLATLQMPGWVFGVSGLVIAIGGLWGAWLNRSLQPLRGSYRQIQLGWRLSLAGCLGQWLALSLLSGGTAATGLILMQGVVTVGFSFAVPNLMADALHEYRAEQGTAGALLGLKYYLLIAAGMGALSLCFVPSLQYQPLAMLVICVLIAPAGRFLASRRHAFKA
ncbi:MAG: MFS transporter [Paludibacterium sp.]|uniref:MFS transporter n=1 Tax=Paludibacterium sp. TaxID=1917523 RepID=UPI0025CD3A6C|nr:MFS transporter [Paludibacterium sp.]MBV8046410.1 MFS transporter [Paludibacterium sp.]MBV8647972.1 MFS transporter [Paludibacterium sp.]